MGVVLAAVVEEGLRSIIVGAAAAVVEREEGSPSRAPELMEEADEPC